MSTPPAVVRTARLTLRPFTADDADALFEVFRRPEVARWSGTGRPMTDRQEAVDRIARQPERAGDHPATGVFAVCVDPSDVPVGMVMLVPIPPSAGSSRRDVEIGWHLHPDAWGHGYATEAATAMVERAWASGIDELVAVTDPDNAASQAVCRRLGMTDLGLRDDWYDLTLRAFRLARSG
ncbi:MAG: GNAT family N-acetyltransferase [Aeromicrobium erythreum]